MKPFHLLLSGFIFLLLSGCASQGGYQLRTGTTDYRLSIDGTQFQDRYYLPPQNSCLRSGDIMDIRLQQVVFSKVVESKLLPADKKNELGIFVTLSERPVTGTANNQTKPNRRLIYASYPRKKYAPLNQINNLVYQGQYKGGDLHLIIEVVEFDSNENELVRSMLGTLIEAGKTTSAYSNPRYSELLNSLGHSIITSFTKDDLIASFDMELLRCDSIKSNPQQIYLSTGDLVFVRQDQDEEKPQIDWQEISLNTDKTLILDDEMSYMTLSIIKRQ